MIIVLSGRSGAGKTSACRLVETALASRGTTVGGVLCGAVFEAGVKVGILVSDVSRGPGHPAANLARAVPPGLRRVPLPDRGVPGTIRYGMWNFDEAALRAADEAISLFISASGFAARRSIAFVDEIGPMELDHDIGMILTLAGLDAVAGRAMAAQAPDQSPLCIVVARPDIAGRLAIRWPRSLRIDMETLSVREAADAMLQALGSGSALPSGSTLS